MTPYPYRGWRTRRPRFNSPVPGRSTSCDSSSAATCVVTNAGRLAKNVRSSTDSRGISETNRDSILGWTRPYTSLLAASESVSSSFARVIPT